MWPTVGRSYNLIHLIWCSLGKDVCWACNDSRGCNLLDSYIHFPFIKYGNVYNIMRAIVAAGVVLSM